MQVNKLGLASKTNPRIGNETAVVVENSLVNFFVAVLSSIRGIVAAEFESGGVQEACSARG